LAGLKICISSHLPPYLWWKSKNFRKTRNYWFSRWNNW